MNTLQIVRAAIPGADAGLADHVLWGMTCHPFGSVTPRDLYRAADRLRRAEANGIALCQFCDAITEPNGIACRRCESALQSAREG